VREYYAYSFSSLRIVVITNLKRGVLAFMNDRMKMALHGNTSSLGQATNDRA
jgi:hypothetical protein